MSRPRSKGRAIKACPSCSSLEVWPILYGMPAGPMERTVIGGCIVSGDDPVAQCQDCNTLIWSDGRTALAGDDARFLGW